MDSLDHLFRRESGRMVATLTRIFGLHNLALAEDVVQDAFLRAAEVWKHAGLPDNPAAWLIVTAKRRALDAVRRERTARCFAPELQRALESEWTTAATVEDAFQPATIKDDQLRMMFTCCHPGLAEEAQVAVILQILCGFTAREIAAAFVSTTAAIEKRIARAKQVLAGKTRLFEIASAADVQARLPAVQRALYLLFNEGYHGASEVHAVRAELCREALYLAGILRENAGCATPATLALAALMCFNAARLPARVGAEGELITLARQDRGAWDAGLIAEGERLLDLAATGTEVSEYHLEAGIASLHAFAPTSEATDWAAITALYDQLLTLRPSPVIALNRAVAVAYAEGPERGLEEIQAIAEADRLAAYPFYHAALGELELKRGRSAAAHTHFDAALATARNETERRFFRQRLRECEERCGNP